MSLLFDSEQLEDLRYDARLFIGQSGGSPDPVATCLSLALYLYP